MLRSKNWKNWRKEETESSDEEEPEEGEEETGKVEKRIAKEVKQEEERIQPTEAIQSEEVAYKASKEAEEAREEEEEEMTELEETAEFCLQCAYKPCICIMLKLELRVKMLRELENTKTSENLRAAKVETQGPSEVVDTLREVVPEQLQEGAELLHDGTLNHLANNQVETKINNNKIMLRLPLEEKLKPPKPIKARKDGPIHRGGVDEKVVSKTKFNFKPVVSQYHGPIHREVAKSEVVEHEVMGELSEQVASEVVSDQPTETYNYSTNQPKLHLVKGESPYQLKPTKLILLKT